MEIADYHGGLVQCTILLNYENLQENSQARGFACYSISFNLVIFMCSMLSALSFQ